MYRCFAFNVDELLVRQKVNLFSKTLYLSVSYTTGQFLGRNKTGQFLNIIAYNIKLLITRDGKSIYFIIMCNNVKIVMSYLSQGKPVKTQEVNVTVYNFKDSKVYS